MRGRTLVKDLVVEDKNFFLTLKKGTKVWKLRSREHFFGKEFLGIYGNGDFMYKAFIRLPMGRYSKEITMGFEGIAILVPSELFWDKIIEASEEISETPPLELMEFVEKIECDFRGNPELGFFTKEFKLHRKGESEILSSPDLHLVKKGEEKAVLHSKEIRLVIKGEKIVAAVKGRQYVISGEKVVGPGIVVSGTKVITRDFVGKDEEVARELIGKALKDIDETLREGGFLQEGTRFFLSSILRFNSFKNSYKSPKTK